MTARPRGWWWRGASALLVVAVVVAAATARVVYSGEREIAASTEALIAGDAHEATVRARRAAAWYAPGAPHVRVAYDRLLALGREAEARRRPAIALLAYEGVREAAISTRWLVPMHTAEVAEAEAAIARIRSKDERPPSTASDPDAAIERELLTALAARPGPSRAASAALGLSFLAWTGGLTWVLTRAVDATGRLDRRRSLPGFVAFAVGLLGWIALLFSA